MSLEYIEHLMYLQSRASIAYLIHLNRIGAISDTSLQEGIRAFSKVTQQASQQASPAAPVDPEKKATENI